MPFKFKLCLLLRVPFVALLFVVAFLLTTVAETAQVSIRYFRMVAPYVCPCEKASLAWGINLNDNSVRVTCMFDFDGDGSTDKVIDNCPLTGRLTFTPSTTGPIEPTIQVMADGKLLAKRATSGFIHSILPVRYSGGREVIRFGKQNPCTFYATDVAIGKDGKVYIADFLRQTVARYDSTGTIDLVISVIGLNPRRLTVDLDGRVYFTDSAHNTVHVYDENGREVAVWDISARFGRVVGSGGIEFLSPDRILLATDDSVLVLTTNGDLIFQFGSPGIGPGQLFHTMDAAAAADGSFFVVDKRNRLQKFDAMGHFLWSIGERGMKAGNFNLPVAVSVGADGSVYVSDRLNFRIQKFDSNGNFVQQWGSEGRGPGQFFWHNGIAIDPLTGNIWVAGYHGYDVQQFTPNGQLVSRWIGHITGPGEFGRAAGIVATSDKVFVVDTFNQQVKAFDKATGIPLYQFGKRGEGDGTVFNFPRAMALSPSGNLYITEDSNIREIAQDGTFVKVFRSLTGNLSCSLGISVYNKTMYQADTNNHTLNARDASSGEAIWIAGSKGSGPGHFERPHGVTVATGPSILVTDAQKRVQTFNLWGRFIRRWANIPNMTAIEDADYQGIAFDSSRQIVYVGGARINAYDICGTPLFSWMPKEPDTLNPLFSHLAVDEEGTVFATDGFGTVYGFVPE